jgi:aspartate/methionine/tyrosine aminotransferase
MYPLAQELNEIIKAGNIHIYEMLSDVGKNLYFPKGILSQSAEAKEKAHLFNATIGMATENKRTMYLPSIMAQIDGLEPEEVLSYAPSFGSMPLRKAWQEALIKKNPSLAEGHMSLPVVTNAITHGLSVVADMWVDPGDTMILPDKMWGNYSLIFTVRRGANMAHYPLFDGNGKFNLKGFEACLRSEAEKKDKLIVVLNFPNNPTGYTISPSEGSEIATLLTDLAQEGKNIIAVTDDAYFGLIYEEDVLKESIFSNLSGRDPRLLAIKLDGATKEDYVWGLRIGFITYGACLEVEPGPFYDALERKTAGDVRGSISNASHLSQSLLLKSMQSGTYKAEKEVKYRLLKGRALELKRVLSDPKYGDAWDVYPFNSGYFMCLKLKTVDAEPLRVHLLDKYGVGLIALGKQDLRVAFSCIEEQDVQRLFDTLLMAIKDLET